MLVHEFSHVLSPCAIRLCEREGSSSFTSSFVGPRERIFFAFSDIHLLRSFAHTFASFTNQEEHLQPHSSDLHTQPNMPPNVRFDSHFHPKDVSEDEEKTFELSDRKKPSPCLTSLPVLLTRDLTAEVDNGLYLREALESIRVLDQRERHQEWLERFGGELHDVPESALERVASFAPSRFAARVADFNENLFYEMQTQRGLDHLGLSSIQERIPAHEYLGSFLTTEATVPQPAHVDFTWQVLEEYDELCLGFFPLTEQGMFLQVWPRKDRRVDEIEGQLIFIPYGKLLVLPASTIHGGGFRTAPTADGVNGNLRFHLYMARGKTTNLPVHQTNKYTEPHDRTRELCERYVDAPHMEVLQRHLFV